VHKDFAARLQTAGASVLLLGCGARTELGGNIDVDAALGPDDSIDQHIDVTSSDVISQQDAPFDAPLNDGAVCCEDGQNTSFTPDDLSGGASVAWQYLPTCNIVVTSIELHNRGGFVALLDSNGAEPGATLFQGTLPTPSGSGLDWVATDVTPPVALEAGQVYWIQEAEGPLSEASGGIAYTYYASTTNGWNGPWNWHDYTSRIHGNCH